MQELKGKQIPEEKLFDAAIHFITEAKPRAFILENVCGLISRGGGKHLSDRLRTLRSSGCHVTWARLNSFGLGLPHNRPRLYIWGLRADMGFELPVTCTGRGP